MRGNARFYSIILVIIGSLFVCSCAQRNGTVLARKVGPPGANNNQSRVVSSTTTSVARRKATSAARTFVRSVEVTQSPSPSPSSPTPLSSTSPSPSRPQRPQKWITQIFAEAESQFDMEEMAVSAECKRDFESYKRHLQNQTVWAVRMLESSEWPSVGIFSGMTDHLGNYDECLWVNTNSVKGQYCLAQAVYDYEIEDYSARQIDGQLDFADESKPVWNALKMYLENPVRVNRHKLSWALCIPSTCKSTELNASLNTLLLPLFSKHGLNVSINVDPIMCMKKEPRSYTTGYYVVSSIYWFILALIVGSTFYEIARRNHLRNLKNESVVSAVFRCFSLRKNWRNLVRYDKSKDDGVIHLTKIFNMIFIIYGHRFIYFIGFPKFNAEYTEMYYRASSIELVHTNVVDVFFMISGFLTFYFGMKPMKRGGVIYLFLSIIFRWIRMVPVFALIIAFIVNVLPYLNDAPLWNVRVLTEVENCGSTWWTNLLAVSNIVKPEKQCLVISWYISTDIQLTIIGSILLFIVCKNRTFGGVVTVLAFIAGTVATFMVAYMNQYHGLLRLYMTLLEDPRRTEEFSKFYVATYNRLGPYLIGFASAFVAHILKEKMFVFSVRKTWLFISLAILLGEACQFYGCLFYLFGREYNRVESSIYASISRSLFVFPYAVTLCIQFTSNLGKFGRFIQRRFLAMMGRITYSVFLINTLLQLYHASSQKSVMPTSSNLNLYWIAIADILLSYFFGLLLHFFAEAPICNMSKLMQQSILNLFMKRQTNSEEGVSGTASDTTDKTNEESAEEGRSQDVPQNIKSEQNGCINQSFDAIDAASTICESVAKETESSRC